MSSRKRKQALALERQQAPIATVEYDPREAELSRTLARRQTVERKRLDEHIIAARYRQKHPQPLDRLDSANTERRWDFEQMHARHVMDGLGAPVLKDSFADYLANQLKARYRQAFGHLCLDRPAQALTLITILDIRRSSHGLWPDAEVGAAAHLKTDVSTVRLRSWKAAKILEADCQGDVPMELGQYIAYRRQKLKRENSKARARAWTFAAPFAQ